MHTITKKTIIYCSLRKIKFIQVSNLHITKMSLNPAHSEVYTIQLYVIKFVSDLQQVGGFLQVFRFPSLIKLATTI